MNHQPTSTMQVGIFSLGLEPAPVKEGVVVPIGTLSFTVRAHPSNADSIIVDGAPLQPGESMDLTTQRFSRADAKALSEGDRLVVTALVPMS